MFKSILVTAFISMASAASAATVTVTGYDLYGAQYNGWGNWGHSYDGTVVSPSENGATNRVDLVGAGSGTLNDGAIPADPGGMNLAFHNIVTTPVRLVLYFDQAYYLNEIEIFSSNSLTNGVPGHLAGFLVSGGGAASVVDTTGFGPVGASGYNIHERADLSGTSISNVMVSSIVLTNWFGATNSDAVALSMGEVVVRGSLTAPVSPVPLPAGMPLLLAALGAVAVVRRSGAKRS